MLPTAIFSSVLGSTFVKVMSVVVAVITIIPVLLKVILVTVQIDEFGYFTRNGKPLIDKKTKQVKLAPPSNYPYLVFPYIRQIRMISTKDVAIDPVPQTLTTSDNVTLTVNMTAGYIRLVDAESLSKSLLGIENPTSEMYNIVTNIVTTQVARMTYNDVREVEAFRAQVLRSCNIEARDVVGAEFTHIRFQSLAKTEAQLQSEGLHAISASIGSRQSDISVLDPLRF